MNHDTDRYNVMTAAARFWIPNDQPGPHVPENLMVLRMMMMVMLMLISMFVHTYVSNYVCTHVCTNYLNILSVCKERRGFSNVASARGFAAGPAKTGTFV